MENENKTVAPLASASGDRKPAHNHEGGHRSNSGRNDRRGGRDNRRGDRRGPVEKLYEERVVKIRRVSKTVKGGRHMRFSALVVIGDGKGKYGYGTGKSNEVPEAIKKALEDAKVGMYRLPIVKNGTIPHTVVGKFGATQVFLKPAPDGTGIIAGGPVRAVLELAGVKNIYSKVYGSRSPINIIKATVEGLNSLKSFSQVSKLRHPKEGE